MDLRGIIMYIKKIHNKYRGDLIATYQCEYCGFTKIDKGTDTLRFYKTIVPNMKCPLCSKRSATQSTMKAVI